MRDSASSLKVMDVIKNAYGRIEVWGSRAMQDKKKRRLVWAAVILLLFSLMLILNILTPLSGDDFGYMFIHAEGNTPVRSLHDIVHSQVNHYYLWGGRSVVHFIAQILLFLPPHVVDVLNSAVYIVFAGLIYWHIKGRGKAGLSLFVLINLAVWFLQPAFGDTILWQTGSANYLWGTTIVLLFMLPYRLYSGRQDRRKSALRDGLKSIGMLLSGILAGWTNENTVAAMLVLLALFFVYYRRRRWNIPLWAIAGLAGAVAGYLLMILAPGNYVRAGEAMHLSGVIFIYRLLTYTQTLFLEYGVFNLFYLGCIIIYLHFKPADRADTMKLSLIYFAGMLVSVYAMLFSPTFPSRAWFGPVVFNIIAAGCIFCKLGYRPGFVRQIRACLLVIGIAMFMFSFYDAYREISRYDRICKERAVQVAEAKEEGIDRCVFERFTSDSKFVHSEEPTSNYMMGWYYDIRIDYSN